MNVRRASSADLAVVVALLAEAGLPAGGIDLDHVTLLVGEDEGTVVAAAAVEAHGNHGLLRSVVVAPEYRGGAVGTVMVAAAVAEAKTRDLSDLWLITEGASGFFAARGWRDALRTDLPAEIALTEEYTAHCSQTAAVMVRELAAP